MKIFSVKIHAHIICTIENTEVSVSIIIFFISVEILHVCRSTKPYFALWPEANYYLN